MKKKEGGNVSLALRGALFKKKKSGKEVKEKEEEGYPLYTIR